MQKQEHAGNAPLVTLQLDGWHLDYFTGLALGYEMLISNNGVGPAYRADRTTSAFDVAFHPEHSHPVLLKMKSVMQGADGNTDWMARAEGCGEYARGDSPAVAMCLALVLAKFGKSVSLPDCALPVSADSYINDSNMADDCGDLFA